MSCRYNYSNLIKNLFNENYNIKNDLIDKEINNLNKNKVYILDNKTIENIEKICRYINFIENIYQNAEQIIYNFYLKLTKIVHAQ